MFTRTYYPSSAGSVIVPANAYAGSAYAGSAYGGPYYGGHYQAPYSAPIIAPSYHHRQAPVIVPTSSYGGYGYGGHGYGGHGYGGHLPYYGAVTPTVVLSGRSSRRSRRHSRHHSRFFDF